MKPEYTNYFIVRKNTTNTEVLIDFQHTYLGVETEIKEDGYLEPKTKVESVKVGSLTMSLQDAIGLRDTLNRVIFEVEGSGKEK